MTYRRGVRTALLAFLCVSLAACASRAPYPQGWTAAGGGVWTSGAQRYTLISKPYDGTLKDLSSQLAVDAVLQTKGTRVDGTVPYPDCPGLAGLMTLSRPKPPAALIEAFTVGESSATIVTYERPPGAPQDAAALQAMKHAVCNE